MCYNFKKFLSIIFRHHSEVIKKRGGKGREEVDSDDHQPLCSLPTDERVDETSIEGNHCWFYGHIPFTDSADFRCLIGTDVEHIRRSSALFLLKLKEKIRITQVAIDDIVEGCQGLFSQTLDRVQASVKAKLAELGIDLSQMNGFDDAFQHVIDPFEGIETCHLQERYF